MTNNASIVLGLLHMLWCVFSAPHVILTMPVALTLMLSVAAILFVVVGLIISVYYYYCPWMLHRAKNKCSPWLIKYILCSLCLFNSILSLCSRTPRVGLWCLNFPYLGGVFGCVDTLCTSTCVQCFPPFAGTVRVDYRLSPRWRDFVDTSLCLSLLSLCPTVCFTHSECHCMCL